MVNKRDMLKRACNISAILLRYLIKAVRKENKTEEENL